LKRRTQKREEGFEGVVKSKSNCARCTLTILALKFGAMNAGQVSKVAAVDPS